MVELHFDFEKVSVVFNSIFEQVEQFPQPYVQTDEILLCSTFKILIDSELK